MFCYTASDRTASPDPVVDKQAVFDQLDVTNPEHADFYLPMFGDSPGGTPSVYLQDRSLIPDPISMIYLM